MEIMKPRFFDDDGINDSLLLFASGSASSGIMRQLTFRICPQAEGSINAVYAIRLRPCFTFSNFGGTLHPLERWRNEPLEVIAPEGTNRERPTAAAVCVEM